MSKKIFTVGRKKKQKPSQPIETWSTDPKDLPPGFVVGSATAPYTPPEVRTPPESPLEKHEPRHSKKDKRRKLHQAIPSSPLTSRSKKQTKHRGLTHEISLPVGVVHTDGYHLKRNNFRRERSCSVDALDELDGELTKNVKISALDIKERKRSCTNTGGIKELDLPLAQGGGSRRDVVTEHMNKPYNSVVRSRSHQEELHKQIGDSSFSQKMLHEPKNVEQFLEAIESDTVDVNMVDPVTGDAPIHSIVKMKKKNHTEFLFALLINTTVLVDLENRKKKTALLLALELGCESCAKILIVFGANINRSDANQFTAIDLVINNGKMPEIESILLDLGARGSVHQMTQGKKKVPRLFSFAQKIRAPKKGERLSTNDNISEFVKRRGTNVLYRELEINVNRRMSMSSTIGGPDDTFALVLQQREIALYNKTLKKPRQAVTEHKIRGGSRLLFLDGGGLKGLVQLEVLMKLEEQTQCSISDLFDWIVGTSTGGVIALAMVYAKKSLLSLRQLYFLMKDRIFMKNRYGFGYNSEMLEKILKDYLDPNIKMSDVSHPKVLIAAVNKATTNLEVHFFNNCFGDEYSDYPVWKVARYTSAAPMMFTEFENYVDGGVICNNPTDCGLTAVQNFCRLQGYKLPIAMVVSIGTGTFPAVKMGNVDAQNALYFGKQWLHPTKLIKQTQNLLSLLSNALVESELVAENSKSRCEEQDIPFFRFSPTFDEIIAAGETDNEKLLNMVIKTKIYLKQQEKKFQEITDLFHEVAGASQDINEDKPIPSLSEVAEEEEEGQNAQKQNNDPNLASIAESTAAEEDDDTFITSVEDFSKKDQLIENENENYTKYNLFRSGSLISSIEVAIPGLLNPNGTCPVSPDGGHERDVCAETSDHVQSDSSQPSMVVHSDSKQALYRHYRADTKQVDTSMEEYTEHKRETLV